MTWPQRAARAFWRAYDRLEAAVCLVFGPDDMPELDGRAVNRDA